MAIGVALFGQDDLIDQPSPLGRLARQPRNRDGTKPALQGFEQRHEVPDREDVVLHERAQCRGPFEILVERMFQQRLPQGCNATADLSQVHVGAVP